MIRLFEGIAGMDLAIEAVASPDLAIARMSSGELDVAALPVNLAAKLYKAGLGYKLVAVVGNGMVSFLTSDPSIKTITDLRGKDIYVAGQGATPEYLFRYLLKKSGLDPDKDVQLKFSMPYPEIAASLAVGKIQYAILPQPFSTLALAKNQALLRPINIDALYRAFTGQNAYPMSVLVAKSSFLDARPAEAKRILEAVRASIRWVVENPVDAGSMVERFDMGLSAAVAAKAIPDTAYTFSTALESRAAIEGLLSIFLGFDPKSIGGSLPDASFYAEIR
jgi:NitT/TauT family transport system substrate-binding protein